MCGWGARIPAAAKNRPVHDKGDKAIGTQNDEKTKKASPRVRVVPQDPPFQRKRKGNPGFPMWKKPVWVRRANFPTGAATWPAVRRRPEGRIAKKHNRATPVEKK